MESLPVEVIGNILSHIPAARDAVLASATCRRWRSAFLRHLSSLSFSSVDDHVLRDLSPPRLELLITQTLLSLSSPLSDLSISLPPDVPLSAAPLLSWLLFMRRSLRRLRLILRLANSLNVLAVLSRSPNLIEELVLGSFTVSGVEPAFQKFPNLKSLELHSISISALDLSLLISACPKIEDFSLISPDIALSDSQSTIELNSATLKRIYIRAISLDKLILEADSLESLYFKDSTLEYFELMGKGCLKELKIDDVSVIHLDIGENAENLEVVDVNDFTFMWPKFYQSISQASKLRILRLWDVVFDVEDEVLDVETIGVCFPKLSHLSLSYEMRDSLVHFGMQGSTQLENVAVLELGTGMMNRVFMEWVAGIIDRCPNLKKLVIHGTISEMKTREDCRTLANFTAGIVKLMRKYVHVDVEFEYQ